MNELVEIPITIKTDKTGKIQIISFKTPRIYFKEPFFIDSLVKNFNLLESQIKLPNEDELLSRPVHYDEKDSQIVCRNSGVNQETKGHAMAKKGITSVCMMIWKKPYHV